MGGPVIDEMEKRYGRLTVIRRAKNRGTRAMWYCLCNCGNHATVSGTNLRSGHTQSCGCLMRDAVTTHGLGNSPEYAAWARMKQRCYNEHNHRFAQYGKRGITIDPRWNKFEDFLEDMGRRPSPNHSLDRVDNDGPYSPANCRWATWTQQERNRTNNHLLTHNDKTQCLEAWADETGINNSTLRARLRRGWSIERTLTTPLQSKYSFPAPR